MENALQLDAVSFHLKLKEFWERGYVVFPGAIKLSGASAEMCPDLEELHRDL